MFVRLFLLFTLVPLVELWLLIRVGGRIGAPATLGIVILTGMVGAALARREGLRTLNGIQTELNAGRLPGRQMVDALLILVAGALLITPGILTDVVGFALLIPPVRHVLRSYLSSRFHSQIVIMHPGQPGGPSPHQRPMNDDLIDVEAHPSDDDDSSA